MSDIELLGCPFCGSDDIAEMNDTQNLHSFQCDACGAQSAWRQGKAYAIAAWNRRASDHMERALREIASAGIHDTDHAMNTKHFAAVIAFARAALSKNGGK